MTYLHNMSSVPQTVIAHAADPHLARTTGILIRLGRELTGVSATAILTQLGVAGPFTPRSARARLFDLINQKARTLPYPPVALVTDRATENERIETDLLTICTVLAKSSSRIYLRNKEPNMRAIVKSRRVVLLIPNDWRPQ